MNGDADALVDDGALSLDDGGWGLIPSIELDEGTIKTEPGGATTANTIAHTAANTVSVVDWPPEHGAPHALLIADSKASQPIEFVIDVGPYQVASSDGAADVTADSWYQQCTCSCSSSSGDSSASASFHTGNAAHPCAPSRVASAASCAPLLTASPALDTTAFSPIATATGAAIPAADVASAASHQHTSACRITATATAAASIGLPPSDIGCIWGAARWRVGVRCTIRAATVYKLVHPDHPDADLQADYKVRGSSTDPDRSDADYGTAAAVGALSSTTSGVSLTPAGTAATAVGTGRYYFGRVTATYVRRVAWQPSFLVPSNSNSAAADEDTGPGETPSSLGSTSTSIHAAELLPCGDGGHVLLQLSLPSPSQC